MLKPQTLPCKPSAVLLDWDNHLVDSKNYYQYASQKAIEIAIREYDFPEPGIKYKDKNQKSYPYFISQFGQKKADQLMELRETILLDSDEFPPGFKAGAIELLYLLRLNNIPHAIFSDTPQARLENNVQRSFERYNIPAPPLVGTIKNEVPEKPNPAGIFKALEILNQQNKLQLIADLSVFFLGDNPQKDGQAAINAGVYPIIISKENPDNLKGCNLFKNLNQLNSSLAKTFNKELIRPNYFNRLPYTNTPREETRIITGKRHYIESPATDNPADGITLSKESEAFHNLRWIAKRGKNLDGTGAYSKDEKLAAGHKVVQELLDQEIVNQLVQKVVGALEKERKENPDSSEKIIIHNPNIGYSKNMLRIAFIQKLSRRVNSILLKDYPELNAELQFGDQPGKPIFNVLSIQQSFEEIESLDSDQIQIESLGVQDVRNSLTQKRSTGNLLERLVKQALFSYHHFKKGDLVILADDHVQTGATLITLYQQLKLKGVKVIALISLATIPESTNLQAHEDAINDLNIVIDFAVKNQKEKHIIFKEELKNALSKLGLTIPSLSNREILSLMAFIIEGKEVDQLNWFKNLLAKYGYDKSINERAGDSLIVQASLPAISSTEFKERIEIMIPKFTISLKHKTEI